MRRTLDRYCPVCDERRTFVRLFGRRDALDGREYSIVACTACRFQTASPLPDLDDLADFYRRSFESGYRNYVRARQLKKDHFRRHFRWLAPHAVPPGRMLDVGCGAGFGLEVAVELGWDAHGLEINPAMAACAAESIRSRIQVGTIEALPGDERYRLVTLFDVVEHVPDPRRLLSTVRRHLAPGGVVALQLPCVDSIACRSLGRHWYHYGPPGHLSYFSLATLRRLCESTGFVVIAARWVAKLFTVEYLAAQLIDQVLDPSRSELGSALRRLLAALPGVGAWRLQVPMSERFVVLAPADPDRPRAMVGDRQMAYYRRG